MSFMQKMDRCTSRERTVQTCKWNEITLWKNTKNVYLKTQILRMRQGLKTHEKGFALL